MPATAYPPYITDQARALVAVDDPVARHELAAEAVEERRGDLAAYRDAYRDLFGTDLDVEQHEHDDQALAELQDCRDRSAAEVAS